MRGLAVVVLLAVAGHCPASAGNGIANPAIDSAAYLRLTSEAIAHRESRRVSEDEFIRLAATPGVIILDTRSRPRYDALHVAGAINLAFPDITVGSLETVLPDKDAIVVIYCNNNFRDAPDPMPTKLAPAALNLATYTALYVYGYRNVYELGPNLSVHDTRIRFERSVAPVAPRPAR